jgi:hypothetical protein
VRVHHALTDTWSEAGSGAINASYPVLMKTVSNAAGYMEFDVSSIVRGEGYKDEMITLAVTTAGGTMTVETREGTNKPQLLVSCVEALPPLTLAGRFLFEQYPHRINVTFSEDVSETLSETDILVQPLGGGTAITLTGLDYDFLSHTATFDIAAGVLPEGRYRATVRPSGIADAHSNLMLETYRFDFHVLAGDANRDGRVDFDDLLILAQNYGGAGSFAEGDFDYSGAVNFDDLLLLAQRYDTGLGSAAVMKGSGDSTWRGPCPSHSIWRRRSPRFTNWPPHVAKPARPEELIRAVSSLVHSSARNTDAATR